MLVLYLVSMLLFNIIRYCSVLILGAQNSGKTSLLRFLRQSLAIKSKRSPLADDHPQTDHTGTTSDSAFKSTYIETEIDGERIGLTLWDSAGLEKNIVDLQLRETVAFIEAKFEETFSEERKVVRAPGVRDTHIHCVFLLLDPARLTPNNHYLGKMADKTDVGGLDPDLDISVFKALHGKTIVVPVISKADTCTSKHMSHLKEIVRNGLAVAKEDPLESLDLEVDDGLDTPATTPREFKRGLIPDIIEPTEDGCQDRQYSDSASIGEVTNNGAGITAGLSFIPLSVISPDSEPGEPVGRCFPWGFADPYNENHCDFTRLKYSVFSEWRAELREKSRENWYENWRSARLREINLADVYTMRSNLVS
jgi:septin family protein